MAAVEKNNENEEKEGEEKAPEKKNSSPLKLIIILIIVLVLIGAGVGAFYFLTKAKTPSTEKKAEQAKPQVAVFWPMEPFIVNLIDNEGERYLKIVLQLELSDQAAIEELNLLKPKIRDSVLDLLSAKTYKEMMDPIGKQRLRDEIVMRANSYATKGKVLKVYFTEFVIQ
jgi:flagellar FliL protein